MRIVLATESYPPFVSGVATSVAAIASELVAKGHAVLVITPQQHEAPHARQGVQVALVPSITNPFRKGHRIAAFQRLRVVGLVEAWKPDLVHIHDPGGIATACLRWARRHRVPVLGTKHFSAELVAASLPISKMVPSETILPLLTTYAREFYQLCDMVTAPSRHARQSMLDEGYTVPIEVLSNGVDIPLEVVRSPEKVPIVLSVTRVDPDKNIDLLLEVARRFSQDARFVIVGGGSLLKQYQEQIAGDQELKHVRFIGQVQAGSAALDRWYQRATLFFVPSLVETQGLALLEAMARAVPALAVRAGALPELVLSKKTGWVADPSADEIEPLLRAALADSSALAAYGTAARKMAEHEHGRPRVIARLEELYASLLKAK